MTPPRPVEAVPKRIQRKRAKGWKMPANTMYVGRPTKWGNPYSVGHIHPRHGWPMSRAEAVECYRDYAHGLKKQVRAALRGKDLACWCRLDQPCHADVLLELANAD